MDEDDDDYDDEEEEEDDDDDDDRGDHGDRDICMDYTRMYTHKNITELYVYPSFMIYKKPGFMLLFWKWYFARMGAMWSNIG